MPKAKKNARTVDLYKKLNDSRDIAEIWKEVYDEMDAPVFHEYLAQLMSEHDIDAAKLGVDILLSRSYMYQICSGERMPGRDIVLRIALVIGLSLDEIQRLLTLANRGILYPKKKRDALFIYALTNRYTLYQTDELFTRYGQEPLL